MNNHKRGWQENLVFCTDIFIIVFCYVGAYFIRFDGIVPEADFKIMKQTITLVLAVRVAAFAYFKLHKSMWQYASIKDLAQIIKAVTVGSVLIAAVTMAFHTGHSRAIYIIEWLFLIVFLSGTRFVIRLTRPLRNKDKKAALKKRVLIAGAGHTGEVMLREILYGNGNEYEVVGFVDDDRAKYARRIHNTPVLGQLCDIAELVEKKNIQKVIIAIHSLKPDIMRSIVEQCARTGAKYRTIPDMTGFLHGTIKVKDLREVRLEDLLYRKEADTISRETGEYIKGRNILITGAGGSIGSELCRQVARFGPAKLALFEKAENPLFYIDMELGQNFKDLNKVPVIGDICDRRRVAQVFAEYKPQIIFHAAAHKHVPLMEQNPMESIKNNVFGTQILAQEAIAAGVERFVMLSTDKAVSPTSFMGVSKKIAEMYISSLNGNTKTKFMAVRFGNVLGSEGSVVPTFRKQIERGGPITITHPDIKRYFMTIPEAAGLVIEAGFMGEGKEIFALEMGKQIKIVDLAKDMIRLSGLEPDKDIKIVFTGLRPGEKMHEALVAADEILVKTKHEKIMVLESKYIDSGKIAQDIKYLQEIIENNDADALLRKLIEIVPACRINYSLEQAPAAVFKAAHKHKQQNREIEILIADDEKIIQELLCKYLEGKGYNTHLASSGREALGVIKDKNVHIAIIDIKMPGLMDGIATLKNIKRIDKNIEVIIITGFSTEKTKNLSNQLGTYAYVEKPFDLVDVHSLVEGALSKRGQVPPQNLRAGKRAILNGTKDTI